MPHERLPKATEDGWTPPSDIVPTYHCYWCRARIVGQGAWREHGKRCKRDDGRELSWMETRE